jgi:hypothetical protein
MVKAMPVCWTQFGWSKPGIGRAVIWVWGAATIFWGGNIAMNPAVPCSPSDVGRSKAGAAMTVWPGLKVWSLQGHANELPSVKAPRHILEWGKCCVSIHPSIPLSEGPAWPRAAGSPLPRMPKKSKNRLWFCWDQDNWARDNGNDGIR